MLGQAVDRETIYKAKILAQLSKDPILTVESSGNWDRQTRTIAEGVAAIRYVISENKNEESLNSQSSH